jgi:PKD repeat protein
VERFSGTGQFFRNEIDVVVDEGTVTMVTGVNQSFFLGQDVHLSGTNSETDIVYLFITGPNLPANGGLLTDPGMPVCGFCPPPIFTTTGVLEDNTWEYIWQTANLNIDPGNYTVYAVALPQDGNNLFGVPYAAEPIEFFSDTRVFPVIPDSNAGEDTSTDDYRPLPVSCPNISVESSLPGGVGYLGDEIVLSGSTVASDTVYLFLSGPNLPAQGGLLTDPKSPVSTGPPQVFTPAFVDDNTWQYRWQTANLGIDPGTYTIYAVISPDDKANMSASSFATLPIILRKPCLTNLSVSSPFINPGEYLFVRGVARGNPSTGVAVWIIGQNFVDYSTISVAHDGTFEHELDGALTSGLSSGRYDVIVQHPMYNDRLDVYPQASGGYPWRYVVGPYPIMGAENVLFMLNGPSGLSSELGLYALTTDLSNPHIDDRYSRLTFVVGEPSSPPRSQNYLSADVEPAFTTQGNEITITGQAQGEPATGVAIWIFGEDTLAYDTVQVNADSGFDYQFPTDGLPDGDYQVVVQHPMYNGRFDVYPVSAGVFPRRYVVGPYPIQGAENILFTTQGPGSLSPQSALSALLYDLNNTNIDDRYTRLKFTVGESSGWGTGDPLSVNVQPPVIDRGENLVILGTANPVPYEVAVWILGKNTVVYDIVDVKPDSSFEYLISDAETRELTDGKYSVVIQHPMANNLFDVYPSSLGGYPFRSVVGRYPIQGSENLLFTLRGPGSLSSPDSLKALVNDLRNPNIDDRFKHVEFQIGSTPPVQPFPGMTNPPSSVDNDTFYRDVNGNGRKDFNDVVIFFKNMRWIPANQPVHCFDYNGNGRIDFNDVVLLFKSI